MCIRNNPAMLERERNETGQLQVWKVIGKDDYVGVWPFTSYDGYKFHLGKNTPKMYCHESNTPGRFHCFFTRKAARLYRRYVSSYKYQWEGLKIIKVYANRKDIVDAGVDSDTHSRGVSVSQMEIKSLKHQR